jgi:hypothetical protein
MTFERREAAMNRHSLKISQKRPLASRNAVTGDALGLVVGLDILPLRTEVWNAKVRLAASLPVPIFRTMPLAHGDMCGDEGKAVAVTPSAAFAP